MNVAQTLLTRTARGHRNLQSLATVATVATPSTALRDEAFSRCHPIKKVATTGNTHLRFNIREHFNLWLSLLPVKIGGNKIAALATSGAHVFLGCCHCCRCCRYF